MSYRYIPAGLAVLALSLLGCSDNHHAAAGPTLSSTASDRNSAGDGAATTYCAANADITARTQRLSRQSQIAPSDYADIADRLDKLGAIAPPELQSNIKILADGYHAIGSGSATMAQLGPSLSKATMELVQPNMELCGPGKPN